MKKPYKYITIINPHDDNAIKKVLEEIKRLLENGKTAHIRVGEE